MLNETYESAPSPDDDPSRSSPAPRKRISVYLVFWLIGCVGLLIFRGGEVTEDGAQTEGFPVETLVAMGLYTALVAIVYLMPQRKY